MLTYERDDTWWEEPRGGGAHVSTNNTNSTGTNLPNKHWLHRHVRHVKTKGKIYLKYYYSCWRHQRNWRNMTEMTNPGLWSFTGFGVCSGWQMFSNSNNISFTVLSACTFVELQLSDTLSLSTKILRWSSTDFGCVCASVHRSVCCQNISWASGQLKKLRIAESNWMNIQLVIHSPLINQIKPHWYQNLFSMADLTKETHNKQWSRSSDNIG